LRQGIAQKEKILGGESLWGSQKRKYGKEESKTEGKKCTADRREICPPEKRKRKYLKEKGAFENTIEGGQKEHSKGGREEMATEGGRPNERYGTERPQIRREY